MNREINFGKYKGKQIKELILTHIGYIMWCLSNISWFKLNKDEQELYDYVAIAAYKSDCDFTFPKGELLQHIQNKDALNRLYSPFSILMDGKVVSDGVNRELPVVKSAIDCVGCKELRFAPPEPHDIVHSSNKLDMFIPFEEDEDLLLSFWDFMP